jgi:hypothetical protein
VLPLALAMVLLASCGAGGGARTGATAAAGGGQESIDIGRVARPVRFRFFSPSSFWNTPIPATAPLDPESAPIMHAFRRLVSAELEEEAGPAINTTEYSVPVYKVPADQPTVTVRLTSPYPATALRSAWSAVPLPPDAQPSRGNDKHLVVWQPSTDRLWEFWELEHWPNGWVAGWGGAISRASSDSGVYGPEAWPGATTNWGASASSLSIAGGLIRLGDLEHGWINHALSMSIPDVRAGVYSSPAERTDGRSTDPLSLPEGAHLRLDPNLDIAGLGLPRMTRMLAEAAQRFGIFIRDGAQNVAFQAQDPVTAGGDPYLGLSGYFEGSYPRELLSSFPWEHLQLLKMELHPYG